MNPGGPGGSGVDYAAAADRVVTPQLHDAFDIVGFDPRGVGKSQPLNCLTGSQIDEFLATDATPDDQQEADTLVTESKEFGADCLAASAEMTAHIGSTNVVKDMDILRSALNQQTLDYLGFSYGTLLGAMYADEFTDRVGRFVLDGAMDPSLSNTEIARARRSASRSRSSATSTTASPRASARWATIPCRRSRSCRPSWIRWMPIPCRPAMRTGRSRRRWP